MSSKIVISWVFAFGLLASTTYYVVAPQSANATVAYAAEKDKKVVVLDYQKNKKGEKIEKLRGKLWGKLRSIFVRENIICSVSQAQFDELQNRYSGTKLETMEYKDKELTFVEVPREEANAGEILRYLREDDKSLHCTVVPHKSWYLMLFGGNVS